MNASAEPSSRFPTRIGDSTKLVISGLIWLGVVLVIVSVFALGTIKPDNSGVLVRLFVYGMFSVTPLLPFIAACFLIWHKNKFGEASLLLESFPVTTGCMVSGTITVSKPLTDFQSVELRLICARVILPGRFSPGSERVIWKTVSLLRPEQIAVSANSTIIPVHLEISSSAPASRNIWFGGEICWELQVEAFPKDRLHFVTGFRIPVVGPNRQPLTK